MGHENCSVLFAAPPPPPANWTPAPMGVYQEHVALYANGHVTLSVITLGLLSNILAFLAFFSHAVPRMALRPNIYVYLMSLCVWDSFLLTSAALLYAIPTVLFRRQRIVGFYIRILPVAFYMSNATLIGSLWMVVALCVDRYFALCHPFWHRKLANRTSIRRSLITLSALIALYSLPHYFDFKVLDCLVEQNGTAWLETRIALSEMRKNVIYRTAYKVVGGLIFYSLCPFVLLAVLTFMISIKLRLAHRKRVEMMSETGPATMQRLQIDKTNNNDLLLAVIVKFTLCHMLPTSLDVAEAMMGDSFIGPRIITYLVSISSILGQLYFYYSSTFRSDCARVLFSGQLCPKQVSALRAAAPAFRATLRWNGAIFVGPSITDREVSVLADNPSLYKRRSAIPSFRSTRTTASPDSRWSLDSDGVCLPVPSVPSRRRSRHSFSLRPPTVSHSRSHDSRLHAAASETRRSSHFHLVVVEEEGQRVNSSPLQRLLTKFSTPLEGTLV